MLNEITRKNRTYGVKSAEERNGYSVKAHTWQRAVTRVVLFYPAEVIERRAEPRKRARYSHCDDNVFLIFHTRVFCGVFIVTGCFEFVSECR